MNEVLPEHSPLGMSSAKRWMECPASVSVIQALPVDAGAPSEYAALGTAAHALGATCLEAGTDAWEYLGHTVGAEQVTIDMVGAVQEYIAAITPLMATAEVWGVEDRFHQAGIHAQFYGRIDFWAYDHGVLTVVDYKHGEGLAIDVADNPQLMGYGVGKLADFPAATFVDLVIVQPRAYHKDGSVRRVRIAAGDLRAWGEKVLERMMRRVAHSADFHAGDWCRFCPAKIVCPRLGGMFHAAVVMGADGADPLSLAASLTPDRLGAEYAQIEAAQMYIKAIREEVFRRLSAGGTVPGTKLVPQKANRVFRDGAEAPLAAALGAAAYSPAALLSPAKIEKLGSTAKALVAQWAHTPATGLTVALASDARAGITIDPASVTFRSAVVKLAAEGA